MSPTNGRTTRKPPSHGRLWRILHPYFAAIVAAIVGAIVAALIGVYCITKKPSVPVEIDCKLINPVITSPTENETVASPVDVTGSVDEIPHNCFLWVAVYNPNTTTYGDFEPINVDRDKRWKRTVKLIGGKNGNEYCICLILADKEGNNELIKVMSQAESSLPNGGKGMTQCCHISVKFVD